MEAHVIGFAMWVKAVEKAKSTDPDKVIDALPGIEAPNLTGGVSKMLPNHHITKPVFIGEVRADGQFEVVWKTPGLVPGDAWSKDLEGSKDLVGDWVNKKCGNFNTKTNKCGGANDADAPLVSFYRYREAAAHAAASSSPGTDEMRCPESPGRAPVDACLLARPSAARAQAFDDALEHFANEFSRNRNGVGGRRQRRSVGGRVIEALKDGRLLFSADEKRVYIKDRPQAHRRRDRPAVAGERRRHRAGRQQSLRGVIDAAIGG